jgi:uncharacterized protein (TIGR03437 family)
VRRLPWSLSLLAPVALSLQLSPTTIFAQSGSSISAILSAADYSPSVAPGSIAALFGTSLASSPTVATFDSHGNLPESLAGVSIVVAGIPAPLFYVSPTQVNFLIPASTPIGQAGVVVTISSGGTVTGAVTVVPVAPAIFVYGNNRGAVANAISGSLEPFDVTDPSVPDGQTRLAIYATGVSGAKPSPGLVQVFAQAPGTDPTELAVEYAGPQGYYVGLDQINVVLPSSLNGVGDVQMYIQMGLAQSNSAFVRIRYNTGPTITSLSSSAGPPQAAITLLGSNFAFDTPNSPAGPRNLITFETSGQAVTSVVPYSASSSQLLLYVPYDQQPQGNYLAGTYTVCVKTDGRKACGATPFTIQALEQAPNASTGQAATQFLSALTEFVNGLSGNALEPGTADTLKATFAASISQLQASIDSAVQGKPTYLSTMSTSGVRSMLLTTQGIASFEALIGSSGATAKLRAMAAQMRVHSSSTPRSVGPFAGDEQGLLDAAQEYNSLVAAQSVVQTVTDSTIGKIAICGLDFLSDGGATAVFGVIDQAFSGVLFVYELNKIFLNRIDITPSAISIAPGSQSTFQVQGEFVRGKVAASLYTDTTAYLTQLVADQLGDALGTIDCGDSLLGILSLPTTNLLNNVAGSLVNFLLGPLDPAAQELRDVLDQALQDNNPSIIPLSSASVLSHNPSPSNFQLQFSSPGQFTGAVSGISATNGYQQALFIPSANGLLLSSDTNPTGSLSVQVTQSVPPSATIQASVIGQNGSGNPQVFNVSQGNLLQITLQAMNVSSGTGSVASYMWMDGSTPIGTTQTVTTSIAAGLHHISCVLENSSGSSYTAQLDVLVNSPATPAVHFSMQDASGTLANDGGSLNETVPPGSQAQLTLQAKVGSAQLIVSYTWSSDGVTIGNTATIDAGFATGNHTIKLTATDNLGSVGAATASVNVVSAGTLKAAFNFSGNGQSGQENSVASYQVPPGGTVLLTMWADRSQGAASYSWSLDAKPFSQAETATVSVAKGSHTLALTVGNGNSGTNSTTATIVVTETTGAAAPSAVLALSAQNQTAGNNGVLSLSAPSNGSVLVTFDGSASTAGSGTISGFEWQSNGSLISSQPTFSMAFTMPSAVTLTITNSNGLVGTASAQINLALEQSGTPSISSISTSPSPPVSGQPFNFTITGTNFDPSSTMVMFNGPGCNSATPCVVGTSALSSPSNTKVSGAAVLAAGTFAVIMQNGPSGAPSPSVTLVVSTTATALQVGLRVMAAPAGANVRNAQLSNPPLFQQVGGVHGTIIGGPSYGTADGFTGNWWEVSWDAEPPNQNGQSGWSAESVISIAPTAGDVSEPDFLDSNYGSSTNIFWASGNAPNTTNPPSPQLGSALGNCTWYAFGRSLDLGASPTVLNVLHGNAGEWASEAVISSVCSPTAGVCADTTPTVHSIAQLVSAPGFSLGHVAVVESLNSDGTITVTESSYDTTSSSVWNFLWRHRTVSPTWFSYFIHVTAAAPPPSISGLSPSSYPANNNNQSMQINGSSFQSGATVTFHDPQGNSYPNKPATFVSSSQLSLMFNNNNDAGTWTVTIVNPGGQSSSAFNFTVSGAAPSVSGVSPNPVPGSNNAQQLTINGSNFASGATATYHDPQGNSYPGHSTTFVNSGQLTDPQFNDNNDAGTWTVTIVNPGGQSSSAFNFTVSGAAPSVSGVSPNPVPGSNNAQQLTINGSNFASGATATYHDPQGNSYPGHSTTFVNSGQLTDPQFNDNNDAGTWTVTIVNPGGQSSSAFNFTVSGAAPSVSGVSPNPVPGSNNAQQLTINGSNFASGATATYHDPQGNSYPGHSTTFVNSGQLTDPQFNDNNDAGTWTVTIVNPGGQSSSAFNFTVSGAAPSVSGVSPNPVPGSNNAQQLTINGSNFASGATATYHDPQGNSYPGHSTTFVNSGQLTDPQFNDNNDAGTWTVTIVNPGGQSSSAFNFTVSGAAPSVSGVSPNPVPGSNNAQQLTINGSNFASGATATYHDPQGNSYPGHSTTFVNSGQLTDPQFNDNNDAGTWTVTIVNPGGQSSSAFNFTVSGAAPSVSGVSPNPVPGSNNAQQLTINGSNFASGATATYHDPQGNSYPGHSTTFVNSGQLTDPQFNDNNDAGTWTVTIVNPGGQSSSAFNFTVSGAAPSVSGVSPNPVPGSNNAQQLTINGSNFASGATATYHDPQGNSYPGHSTTFVNSGQLIRRATPIPATARRS